MDLRCPKKWFGEVFDLDGQRVLEVKCKSLFCGSRPGVVVLHRFDLNTGRLINTMKFKDPNWKEVNTDAPRNHPASVRTA